MGSWPPLSPSPPNPPASGSRWGIGVGTGRVGLAGGRGSVPAPFFPPRDAPAVPGTQPHTNRSKRGIEKWEAAKGQTFVRGLSAADQPSAMRVFFFSFSLALAYNQRQRRKRRDRTTMQPKRSPSGDSRKNRPTDKCKPTDNGDGGPAARAVLTNATAI